MVLIDSSVWVDHLRLTNATLVEIISDHQALTHPFIVGELALGSIKNRRVFLSELSNIPRATVATDAEVLSFIERRALFDRGIGFMDAHLLASTLLTEGAKLWTFDRRLLALAEHEECAADLPGRQPN